RRALDFDHRAEPHVPVAAAAVTHGRLDKAAVVERLHAAAHPHGLAVQAIGLAAYPLVEGLTHTGAVRRVHRLAVGDRHDPAFCAARPVRWNGLSPDEPPRMLSPVSISAIGNLSPLIAALTASAGVGSFSSSLSRIPHSMPDSRSASRLARAGSLSVTTIALG